MIKIDSTVRLKPLAGKKTSKKEHTFFSSAISDLSLGTTSSSCLPISETPNAKSIDSVLSVQDISQKSNSAYKTYVHSQMLVDQLEIIKLSILEGNFSAEKISNLKNLLNDCPVPSENLKLEKIRHLIEQRVNIEIAKFEKNGHP